MCLRCVCLPKQVVTSASLVNVCYNRKISVDLLRTSLLSKRNRALQMFDEELTFFLLRTIIVIVEGKFNQSNILLQLPRCPDLRNITFF